MDIRRIYQYALEREREGKRFYDQNAERLSSAAAVGAFKRLAKEEQKHIEYVQEQIDLLDTGRGEKIDRDLELEEFFQSRLETESLYQTVSEAMVADLPVLRMAYLIERDFAEFYENAATQAEGEARRVLESLAEWERKHEAFFKKMHDEAWVQYAKMPWGG